MVPPMNLSVDNGSGSYDGQARDKDIVRGVMSRSIIQLLGICSIAAHFQTIFCEAWAVQVSCYQSRVPQMIAFYHNGGGVGRANDHSIMIRIMHQG